MLLARWQGGYEKKFSLAPVAPRLAELLGKPVPLVPDCRGIAVGKATQEMKDGDVVLLENSRFYGEEEKNSKVGLGHTARARALLSLTQNPLSHPSLSLPPPARDRPSRRNSPPTPTSSSTTRSARPIAPTLPRRA